MGTETPLLIEQKNPINLPILPPKTLKKNTFLNADCR